MSGGFPQGWSEVELSCIADLVMGQSPPSHTYNTQGKGLPFFQGKTEFGALFPQPVKNCSSPSKIAEPGDILISVRAPVGPTNLCQEKSCIGRGLAAIRPQGEIPSRYLLYYLRSIEGWLSQQGIGSTFAAISRADLEQLPVRLAPLSEQRRIVTKLEKLLGRVGACHRRLAKVPVLLKRFRQSVLAAACSGRLTQDLATTGQCDIRKEMSLGEIVSELRTGPFGSALHKADYSLGGTPVINPVNIVAGRITPSPRVTVSPAICERLANYALREGDIVIARRGEMGRCAVVTVNETGWLCGTGSAILRLSEVADPAFVQILISSPSVRSYLSEASVGTTMENLNQSVFRAMPISLPPLAEQREIVQRVGELFTLADQIEARLANAKSEVDQFTPSLLAKAFRGELVPTEAELAAAEGREFESADQLLERIGRESQKQQTAQKPARKTKGRSSERSAANV